MESVHRNDDGVPCVVVLEVELPGHFDEAWIWNLRPKSHGHNSTPFRITHGSGFTRWYELIANRDQAVPYDITRPIALRLGWSTDDPRIKVKIIAGVKAIGASDRRGSPRAGKPHRTRHYPPDQGAAAS